MCMEPMSHDYRRMLDLAVAVLEGQEDPWRLVCEELVHVLRGMRQERREERLQAVDRAQRQVQNGARTSLVRLDERPRRLVGDVLIDGGRKPHCLTERRPEATGFEMGADRPEARVDAVDSP